MVGSGNVVGGSGCSDVTRLDDDSATAKFFKRGLDKREAAEVLLVLLWMSWVSVSVAGVEMTPVEDVGSNSLLRITPPPEGLNHDINNYQHVTTCE